MADATSVSYRKGTTTEHDVFHGVKGEITVDTTNSTVWVHMGDEKKGTPLARSDFKNLDPTALTNAKIANNTLENVFFPNDEVALRVRRDNLGRLHYAYDDMKNIDTANLANPRGHAGKDLAYKDLSNVDTSALPIIIGDTTFLKYDMSNVRTTLLTSTSTLPEGQKPLAYAELSNVDTADLATTGHGHSGGNLAYANLSNIAGINKADLHSAGFQITDNLVALNSATLSTQYPTALSVQAALAEKAVLPELPATGQTEKMFLCDGYPYSYEATLVSGGSNYAANDRLTVDDILIQVDTVDSNGTILTCTQLTFFGTTDKSAQAATQSATTGSGSGATFNITSTSTGTSGLGWDTGIDGSTITFTNTYEIGGVTYTYVTPNAAIGPIYTMEDAIRSLGLNQKNKVEMTNAQWKAYGTDANSQQTTHTIDSTATANTIPYRGTNGVLKVGTPSADEDATTKLYVDQGLSGKANANSLATVATSGLYADLTNKPTTITDISVNGTSGLISITLSQSITTNPTVKFLIGGTAISGSWNGSGTGRTFTPTNPDDILLDSWVITL